MKRKKWNPLSEYRMSFDEWNDGKLFLAEIYNVHSVQVDFAFDW